MIRSVHSRLFIASISTLVFACSSQTGGSGASGASSGTSASSSTGSSSSGGGSSTASSSSSGGGSSTTGSSSSSGGSSVSASGSGSTSSSTSGSASSSSGTCAPSKVLLEPAVVVPVNAGSPYDVAVADVDKDGKADLIAATSGGASILLGKGDGTFKPEIDVMGGGGAPLVVADFNGDGWPDLMNFSMQQVSFAANAADGSGNFASFVGAVGTSGGISAAVAADLNGDGKPDLAMITDTLEVALNAGDASFGSQATAYNGGAAWENVFGDTGNSANAIAAADVDGDGNLDIIIASNNAMSQGNSADGGLCIFINTGHGSSFADPVCYPVTADLDAFSLVVADLNGDGAPDAIIGGSGTTNSYNVFINKGGKTGKFKNPVGYTTSDNITATSLALADMNADGKPDLVMLYGYGGIDVALGNGDGTFSESSTAYSGGNGPGSNQGLATGVFTANGLTSIVASDIKSTTNAPNGGLDLLLGTCSN